MSHSLVRTSPFYTSPFCRLPGALWALLGGRFGYFFNFFFCSGRGKGEFAAESWRKNLSRLNSEIPPVLLGIPWPALRGPLRNHFWKKRRPQPYGPYWGGDNSGNALEASSALNYRVWGIPAVLSTGIPGKALRAFPVSFRNFSGISSGNSQPYWGCGLWTLENSTFPTEIVGIIKRGVPQACIRARASSETLRSVHVLRVFLCIFYIKWEFDTYQNGLGHMSDTYPNPYPPVTVPPLWLF